MARPGTTPCGATRGRRSRDSAGALRLAAVRGGRGVIRSDDGRARLGGALTFALAAGFHLTVWCGVASLVAASVWFAGAGADAVPGVPGWSLSGWCAFTALFVVVAQFIGSRSRAAGRALPREEAPELFRMMDEVREALGAPTVRDVRLKPAPVIGVTRLWRRRGMVLRQYRVLVIGLPLLRAYTADELRGAIAHEFTHFLAGDVGRRRVIDTALSRIGLMRTVLARGRFLLTWANPLWWFLSGYGFLMSRAVGAIRRSQECRADSTGAAVVGSEIYARALLRGAVVSLHFRRLALGVIVRARREDRRVENFFAEFTELSTSLPELSRERAVRVVLREVGSALDEHPPLRERLTHLGYEEPPELPEEDGSAALLVPALTDIERELTPLAVRGLALGLGDRLRRRLAASRSLPAGPVHESG